MRLKDKVSIVTGVGAGIGESIALRFAEEGALLVLNDLNEEDGQRVAALARAKGAQVSFVQGDIALENTARQLSQTALDHFGAIHILVNNAADFTQKSLEDASLGDWTKVFNVNVFGTAMVIIKACFRTVQSFIVQI